MEKNQHFYHLLLCLVVHGNSNGWRYICHTDQDCIDIGIPRCKTGKMPICYNGYWSCFAKGLLRLPPLYRQPPT
ncbi:unnamed protein product, partial [Brassica napus]